MEIPGISPLSGQPTLTNPLSRERSIEGRDTQALERSETQNTTVANEQASTSVRNADVVTQTEETSSTNLDANNIGGSIDITA